MEALDSDARSAQTLWQVIHGLEPLLRGVNVNVSKPMLVGPTVGGALLLLLVVGFSVPRQAWGDEKAAIYAHRVYNNSTCESALNDPGNLMYADNIASRWQDAIDEWGSFEENEILADSTAEAEDYIDVSKRSYGTDTQYFDGMDTYDVVYVVSHGTFTCTSGAEASQYGVPDTLGTPSWNRCVINTRNEVLWGNTDMNLFYTSACNSVQKCVWNNGGYAPMDSGDFVLYAGYHGDNVDGPGIPGNIEDFVSSSRWSGAGSNWLAEMTHIRLFGNNDDCPVVQVWARVIHLDRSCGLLPELRPPSVGANAA